MRWVSSGSHEKRRASAFTEAQRRPGYPQSVDTISQAREGWSTGVSAWMIGLVTGAGRLCCLLLALIAGLLAPVHAIGPLPASPDHGESLPPTVEPPPPAALVYLAAYRAQGPPGGRAAITTDAVNPGIHADQVAVTWVLFVEIRGGGRSATANLYAYCGGDPVNRSDPSGLDWEYVDGEPGIEYGTLWNSSTPGHWRYVDGSPITVPKPHDEFTPKDLGLQGNRFTQADYDRGVNSNEGPYYAWYSNFEQPYGRGGSANIIEYGPQGNRRQLHVGAMSDRMRLAAVRGGYQLAAESALRAGLELNPTTYLADRGTTLVTGQSPYTGDIRSRKDVAIELAVVAATGVALRMPVAAVEAEAGMMAGSMNFRTPLSSETRLLLARPPVQTGEPMGFPGGVPQYQAAWQVLVDAGAPTKPTVQFGLLGDRNWLAAHETIATDFMPRVVSAYQRPSGATTRAQRLSVQGRSCVTCGQVSTTQVADHTFPLVQEYYQTGGIDRVGMRSVAAVQPQCPTCSNRQGSEMQAYSALMRKLFGVDP